MRHPLALAALLSLCTTAQGHAGTIFADDFESTVNTRPWQVYNQISNGAWRATQGNGIEIQTSGGVTTAHSGNQFIELDSDHRNGGIGPRGQSNSAMTRTLTNLDAGEYLLTYAYQARTNRANDNTIGVYFDAGSTLFSDLVDTANGVGANGWIEHSVPLFVAEDGSTRRLSFRAEGIENTLGGLIDTVSLTRTGGVPEPLPLALVALAGLFGWRRAR